MSQKTHSKTPWLVSSFIGLIISTFLVWWIFFKTTGVINNDFVLFIPYLNCFFNTLTASLLLFGYYLIKKGERDKHRNVMISAAVSSFFFLIGYLIYHHYVGDTKFQGTGIVRPIYFFILISHVLLSVIQIPCILVTFYFAFSGKWELHKKSARVTFPIWLYVSVTGVTIFCFIKYLS
jgi:putative membrane protein